MQTKDLQNVMWRAWAMHRNTGANFSLCLKQSWILYRTTKTLRNNNLVHIEYMKLDGTKRLALGTLKSVDGQSSGTADTGRKTNHGVFTYFDIEKGGFRSFRCENFRNCYL